MNSFSLMKALVFTLLCISPLSAGPDDGKGGGLLASLSESLFGTNGAASTEILRDSDGSDDEGTQAGAVVPAQTQDPVVAALEQGRMQGYLEGANDYAGPLTEGEARQMVRRVDERLTEHTSRLEDHSLLHQANNGRVGAVEQRVASHEAGHNQTREDLAALERRVTTAQGDINEINNNNPLVIASRYINKFLESQMGFNPTKSKFIPYTLVALTALHLMERLPIGPLRRGVSPVRRGLWMAFALAAVGATKVGADQAHGWSQQHLAPHIERLTNWDKTRSRIEAGRTAYIGSGLVAAILLHWAYKNGYIPKWQFLTRGQKKKASLKK